MKKPKPLKTTTAIALCNGSVGELSRYLGISASTIHAWKKRVKAPEFVPVQHLVKMHALREQRKIKPQENDE